MMRHHHRHEISAAIGSMIAAPWSLRPAPYGSLIPAFLAGFAAVYLIGYFAVFRSWPDVRRRAEASSCLTSLFHGTPAVALALLAVFAQQAPSTDLAALNGPAADLTFDFSIAYFSVDLAHYVLLVRDELLFIAHHVAALYVLVTCRLFVRRGAPPILALLAIAEATSLLQNAWTLAGMMKNDSPEAARLHRRLSLPFYVLYTAMRGVLAPAVFCWMSAFYVAGEGRKAIPRWAAMSWLAVVGSAIVVSVLWVSNLWMEFFAKKRRSEAVNNGSSDSTLPLFHNK